jgi:hypothetical protein
MPRGRAGRVGARARLQHGCRTSRPRPSRRVTRPPVAGASSLRCVPCPPRLASPRGPASVRVGRAVESERSASPRRGRAGCARLRAAARRARRARSGRAPPHCRSAKCSPPRLPLPLRAADAAWAAAARSAWARRPPVAPPVLWRGASPDSCAAEGLRTGRLQGLQPAGKTKGEFPSLTPTELAGKQIVVGRLDRLKALLLFQ